MFLLIFVFFEQFFISKNGTFFAFHSTKFSVTGNLITPQFILRARYLKNLVTQLNECWQLMRCRLNRFTQNGARCEALLRERASHVHEISPLAQ